MQSEKPVQNQKKMELFDPASVSLRLGTSLVEASAGTGKTYAIAMLVLRFITEKNITIDKILIVTFTRAATEELRIRIRAKIAEGKEVLSGELKDADQTMLDWATKITNKKEAIARLQLALYDIDQAGVFTIHSFCQRMLVEQALESGQLFDLELLSHIDHIKSEVVDDYWRKNMYSLSSIPCSLLISHFSTPDALYETMKWANVTGTIVPNCPSFQDAVQGLNDALPPMSNWWNTHSNDLYECYSQTKLEGKFKKDLTNDLDTWWLSLNEFFKGTSSTYPGGLSLLSHDGILDQLNGTKLRGDKKKLAHIEDWSFPDAILDDLIKAAEELLLTFRVNLATSLIAEVEKRLSLQGCMSFDDLITRLARAAEGEHGASLRKIFDERFKVALIDEFQDTDNQQWQIFSTFFGQNKHYLYLIGDPKQAIYKFRGADIYSYFSAKNSADYQLTLHRNYRSHPALIQEVNSIFGGDRPFAFDKKDLPYNPVLPAKSENDLYLEQNGKNISGMQYCQLSEGPLTSGVAADKLLDFCLAEISNLLDTDSKTYLVKDDERRLLQPKDIVLLVRSHRQAEACQEKLGTQNIPTVVSSKQSIFQTAQSQELLLVLQSIAQPGNLSAMKAAMTTPWFGLSGNDVDSLWQDETELESLGFRFMHYQKLWQDQGILAMATRLLMDEKNLQILASKDFPERVITNILHLLEVFSQEESQENFGMSQTLQWFRNVMSDEQGGDDVELRLENDDDAVRIMTMHSSKGLEFPVVFCPYLWYRSRRMETEKYVVTCHAEDGSQLSDFGSGKFKEHRELAAQEEMAEDLRLLYVALTRAAVRCYVMWGDIKASGKVGNSFSSGLGYLLFPEGKTDIEKQMEWLKSKADKSGANYHLIDDSILALKRYERGEGVDRELSSLSPGGRSLHTDWQMSSYSALAGLSEYQYENLEKRSEHENGVKIPVVGLPAGANFGNLIHDTLEKIPFSSFILTEDSTEHDNFLIKTCSRYGLTADLDSLRLLLKNIVSTKLLSEKSGNCNECDNFTLADVTEKDCLKEMPFYFQLGRVSTDQINAILKEELGVAPLSRKVMQGYLIGFIDLICVHNGKFYVIDYKTNFLGDKLANYGQEDLVQAMASHNYGLQFWIYSLVLHRHLQNVLPGYSYETHFGGVMYLFVRGMTPDTPGSGVFATVPDNAKIKKLNQILERV